MHDATSARRSESSRASFGFLRTLQKEKAGRRKGRVRKRLHGLPPAGSIADALTRCASDLARDLFDASGQRRRSVFDEPFPRAQMGGAAAVIAAMAAMIPSVF